MKLQQIAIGARFEYQGKIYLKTGPLTASSEEGGQQLIPRYAMLRPLDVPEAPPAPGLAARRLDPARVRAAFETFYAESLRCAVPEQVPALEAARAEFLGRLK